MAKSMKRIHKVTITDMEATMTHTSKGELSDLNLTSGQWHYVENASDGGLRQSLGDDNCQGDFAEAIRRELKQRSAGREKRVTKDFCAEVVDRWYCRKSKAGKH